MAVNGSILSMSSGNPQNSSSGTGIEHGNRLFPEEIERLEISFRSFLTTFIKLVLTENKVWSGSGQLITRWPAIQEIYWMGKWVDRNEKYVKNTVCRKQSLGEFDDV